MRRRREPVPRLRGPGGARNLEEFVETHIQRLDFGIRRRDSELFRERTPPAGCLGLIDAVRQSEPFGVEEAG